MDLQSCLYVTGGSVKLYSHFGNSWHHLVKLDIQMPYKPAAPLPGKHSRTTLVHVFLEMCTRTVIPALSINSKNLETIQCTLTEE